MAAPRGNQYAKKAKVWTDAIKRALCAAVPANHKSIDGSVTYEHGLDLVANRLIQAALDGDTWALGEIGNRLEGKPVQIIAGDDELPPVKMEGFIVLRRPNA